MDYNKIEDGLYQGGMLGRVPSEINAIINLRSEVNDKLDPGQVRAYVWLPIDDVDFWPGDTWLDTAADILASLRYFGLNVLVHCAAGISRASMVVCGYLIRHRGMTFDQAMEYICKHRPVACPNPTFTEHLKAYSRKLRDR